MARNSFMEQGHLFIKKSLKTEQWVDLHQSASALHCVKNVCMQSFSDPYFPARENADQKNSEYGHFSRCAAPEVTPCGNNIHGNKSLR